MHPRPAHDVRYRPHHHRGLLWCIACTSHGCAPENTVADTIEKNPMAAAATRRGPPKQGRTRVRAQAHTDTGADVWWRDNTFTRTGRQCTCRRQRRSNHDRPSRFVSAPRPQRRHTHTERERQTHRHSHTHTLSLCRTLPSVSRLSWAVAVSCRGCARCRCGAHFVCGRAAVAHEPCAATGHNPTPPPAVDGQALPSMGYQQRTRRQPQPRRGPCRSLHAHVISARPDH
jgi:hypothetical protein